MRERLEWLETDGLGGFASGTAAGIRTRRYHALLLAATTPPTGRVVLVNGLETWVETEHGRYALSSQRYAPDVIHPDGAQRLASFANDPWPQWTYRLEDDIEVVQELLPVRGRAMVALSWRARTRASTSRVTLYVRPLISGRDTHALHRENPSFRFDAEARDGAVQWRPYDGLPTIFAVTNGHYTHEPLWYRNFLYAEEAARGLDCIEDLASPGVFRFELTEAEAVCLFAAASETGSPLPSGSTAGAVLASVRQSERARRAEFPSRLHRAVDDYLVRRGDGKTIVAGYPWFSDWGRDTFISIRGLCIASGRLEDARGILLEWAGRVSEGMLPNYFPERGQAPEFNSVDASLWYVIAVHDFLRATSSSGDTLAPGDRAALAEAVEAILAGYSNGTRYRIHADVDGLLAAGEPGQQLTWMDARVGNREITPRIGKPVEVEALWINALRIGSTLSPRWRELYERALSSFTSRFWNGGEGCLYDVVDVDHERGRVDATFRPNQIFAVGGLPFQLVDAVRARQVVAAVEARLWTRLGLRSLAPTEPGYVPRYEGGVPERDGAYHQGTVWPWLAGPFVEAWVRVRGSTLQVRREARRRFLEPLLLHLDEAGLGHVSEIADAEPPHTPRGCPFQAWSVGEALRLAVSVLAEPEVALPASLRSVDAASPSRA